MFTCYHVHFVGPEWHKPILFFFMWVSIYVCECMICSDILLYDFKLRLNTCCEILVMNVSSYSRVNRLDKNIWKHIEDSSFPPGSNPYFEKHLSRSNVLSCSWDVQKKQQTGAHWTGIDTQLGVTLMSSKAFSPFCLFSFNISWCVQVDSLTVGHRWFT